MSKKTIEFDVLQGDLVCQVKATPYEIATHETRFRVSICGSAVYIFGWDNGLGRFGLIDDKAGPLRGNIEMAVSSRLLQFLQQKKAA